MTLRCSDASLAAEERLGATATTVESWLLVEVPGTWPRDVGAEGCLPGGAYATVTAWLERTPRSRLLFLRRPGRSAERRVVFVVRAPESEAYAEVRRLEISSLDELAELDLDTLGERVDTRLVLVCGHGSRDACCALRGAPVFRSLAPSLSPEELWLSSHQGGHRFAANVVVLPAAVQLGRLEPPDAHRVVADVLAGAIELASYRGRTCHEPEVQAAERAVREHLSLLRLADLSLVGVEDDVVRFRAARGSEHAARVERVDGPVVPVSCGVEPERQTAFVARLL